MQESQVQSLIQEDPTCCRAAKPVDHSYEPVLESLGARAIEPTCLGASASQQEKPLQGEACAPVKPVMPHRDLLSLVSEK